jgi:hypothetical protein
MSDLFLNITKSNETNVTADSDLNPDLNSEKEKELEKEKEKELETNVKSIIFSGTNTKYKMKSLNNLTKEPKMRVETQTWGLDEKQLSFDSQVNIMLEIHQNINNNGVSDIIEKNKYRRLIISHIKTKIQSYKHQDTIKKMYTESEFIDFTYVVNLLADSDLKCHYCACETYLLYEIVREMKQWSLDRINNDKGHNRGNLVMSCLECNLKRRRTNKDAFFMTKNMTISREGINDK